MFQRPQRISLLTPVHLIVTIFLPLPLSLPLCDEQITFDCIIKIVMDQGYQG